MNKVKLLNGLSIAFQQFGISNVPKVLCLHGWLDNSNSYSYLGPYLADRGFHVIAIDSINHGYSDHHSDDTTFINLNRVGHVKGFVDAIGWEKDVSIIGHSMGAGVSLLFAGSFPHVVNKLVMIDGFGPVTKEADSSCKALRRAIESEQTYFAKLLNNNNKIKTYSSLETAIQARMRSVASYPGEQSLSYEAAAILVKRGIDVQGYERGSEALNALLLPSPPQPLLQQSNTSMSANDTNNGNNGSNTNDSNSANHSGESKSHHQHHHLSIGQVSFTHDPRELLPSYAYLTNQQVISYISEVTSHTMLIQAEKGWPSPNLTHDLEKAAAFPSQAKFRHVVLPGSHHLHLDPSTAALTAQTVSSFLIEKQ